MSIATTVARLRKLALAIPRQGCIWEERPQFGPPASTQDIAELEHAAGFAFPVELRDFLFQTDSVIAMSIHNGYWLGGLKSFLDGDGLQRVVDGEAAITVATDGGGNAFLLSPSGAVWRWDHETGKTRKVAASFGAFLKRVPEDWEAYIDDRPGWRYLT